MTRLICRCTQVEGSHHNISCRLHGIVSADNILLPQRAPTMKMPDVKMERPVPQPMIMQVSPTALIHAINQCLIQEGREPLPVGATVSVRVPGGGDWSNTDLELDERDRPLEIRWER